MRPTYLEQQEGNGWTLSWPSFKQIYKLIIISIEVKLIYTGNLYKYLLEDILTVKIGLNFLIIRAWVIKESALCQDKVNM